MKRTDYHYHLPPELIAQQPLPERSASRLLVLDGASGKVAHHQFSELLDFLNPDDLLVFNNTRVIPARLWGEKETGGKVEILIERVTGENTALAHIRASKSPKAGAHLYLSATQGGLRGSRRLTVLGRQGALFELATDEGEAIADILKDIGHMPLPPYIERVDDEFDQQRYQTVYAQHDGAVAAPTAGLHFTDELLAQIDARSIARTAVTLHVGAGTFQPVREDDIEQHVMHAERLEVTEHVCQAVRDAKARGGRVVAVGTTAVRALESASQLTGE
ncbi:MAG: S-adenosylmethionine:tRNA ribosyltransferase-isomerase, partial [Halioglobus sp.]